MTTEKFIAKRNYLILFLLLAKMASAQSGPFSLEAIKSYPFPTELAAAATAEKIAWAMDEKGKRNIYVAQGSSFEAKKITAYAADDGQEITSLSLSADGNWVVYVRGGDHGGNWGDALPVNPGFDPKMPKTQVFVIPFNGGAARAIAEADHPVISPKSDSVAFIKGGQVWIASLADTTAARNLFTTHGSTGSLKFSPDGSEIAFVSNRSDHSIIGIYTSKTTSIRWISPSYKNDRNPVWSPDGKRIAFIRTAGEGAATDSLLVRRHQPWSIQVADLHNGSTIEIYKAPETLEGSIPSTHGGFNFHWAAKDRIVFLSYSDGWQHLYSIPAAGGKPLLLTPGSFMAEHISLSQDGSWLYFAGNGGPDKFDIDRRHIGRVAIDKAGTEWLTPGTGLEWSPVSLPNEKGIALISATPQRPPLPAILASGKKELQLLAQQQLPADYPQAGMVTPKQVVFKSPDGFTVHGQLFEPKNGTGKKPAIIYVHGGPPRQMLLGWHYSDYYANAYATNQYLASKGFVVLSVNYRLGIGYGFAFHQPAHSGRMGAAEYQDIRAAGVWLSEQQSVDKSRIGIYGGSYGGYLTAMALARDSKLFAAGVDVHGVHDWSVLGWLPEQNKGFEKIPDLDSVLHLAYLSSPVASLKTWTSPVLIIHADDDRNVPFDQSTDLVKRLEAQKTPMETKVIIDDTHHWMKFENALTLDRAIADFFERKFGKP